jgi:hypothetical protein
MTMFGEFELKPDEVQLPVVDADGIPIKVTLDEALEYVRQGQQLMLVPKGSRVSRGVWVPPLMVWFGGWCTALGVALAQHGPHWGVTWASWPWFVLGVVGVVVGLAPLVVATVTRRDTLRGEG